MVEQSSAFLPLKEHLGTINFSKSNLKLLEHLCCKLRFTPKLLIASFLLASVIAFGTMYVLAQNGPATQATFSDEVTLQGTIVSLDEGHGFTIVADSVTYYVGLPYTFDRIVLDLSVGASVTVTGYIVDSPMLDTATYTMFHATSVNGIIIDHVPQSQSQARSGDCGGMGGNGNMGRHGPQQGRMNS